MSELEKIKNYGLDSVDGKSQEELLAHIEYLEKKLNIACRALDLMVDDSSFISAQETLEVIGVRNWRKK